MENVVKYRRALHAMPEKALTEFQTTAYIETHLKTLPCRLIHVGETGVLALFDNQKDRAVALRADIDALGIEEKTGLSFASVNGCMHACGHDAHAAMLLAVADILAESYTQYDFNILLIFQPAEESFGGAKAIARSGLFEQLNVRRVFGFHLLPDLPKGAIGTKSGPLMSHASEVYVTIEGKAAHCARPEEGFDALRAGCSFVTSCYRMRDTEFDKNEPILLFFGIIQSGKAQNIISAETKLSGSLRTFSEETHERLSMRVREIAAATDAVFGTKTTVEITPGYPSVDNHPQVFEEAAAAFQKAGIDVLPVPLQLPGEDFSEYQQVAPGLFSFLGIESAHPLHNDKFDFDESVLHDGVKAWLALLAHYNEEAIPGF